MSLPPPKSLSGLNQIHRELDGLFFRHQTAVLKSDNAKAKALLRTYEGALMGHLNEEEEILMPLYRARATSIRGGDPELFVQEHQKIDEWLKRIKLRLSRLDPLVDPKDVLALLDDEAHYKKFMEHHSLREDRIFYPELERVTNESEKSALCRLLTFSADSFEDETRPERGRPS
jgi:hemerythrin-like domain-containing protein